jgi:hypothetical protein
VVVVAPNPRVAAWAARPIKVGPGSTVTPIVLGPAEIPRITDAARAKNAPGLALLSALAHGRAPGGLEVVVTAMMATTNLDAKTRRVYEDLIRADIGPSAMRLVEEMMPATKRLGRKWTKEQIKAYEATRDYLNRRWEEKLVEGLVKGRVESLMTVLAARGVVVTPEASDRITACEDLGQLDLWLRRAVSAESLADVLDEPPKRPSARRRPTASGKAAPRRTPPPVSK